jgi:two-component system cell cycle response regulator
MNDYMLVVDDSQYVHKLVRAHLESDPLEIHSVYDGESALLKARELRPNLVLLDVDLPRMDGFEVCRRLKADPAIASVPIIFLTADVALCDKVKGLDMGAVDYITKPFTPSELQARVRAALRNRQKLDETAMIDARTGLWNRSYLQRELAKQLSWARRSDRPVAVIMGEIDELSALIHKFGGAAGDEVIRAVARIIQSHCRTEDVACHLGKGRFAAVLPDTSRAGAAQLADRIRCQIQEQLQRGPVVDQGCTCSFGIADSHSDGDCSLLDRADAALYRAQLTGRNSISVSRPPSGTEVCAA